MDIESLHLANPFDFSGKVAVVTGGSGVLCGAIALGLGSRGASVALVGNSQMPQAELLAERIRSYGSRSVAFRADVTDNRSVELLAESVRAEFGCVDILINGAGGTSKDAVTSKDASFFDLPPDAICRVFDLNMLGTLWPCRSFGSQMVENGSGAILNIISLAAYRPVTRSFAYSASKAASLNFTQWLAVHMAREYSPRIRVNGLAPGIFLASQNRFLLFDERTGELTARGRAFMDHTPMARFGKPEELIGVALLLVSDLACYMTGETINVDGGQAVCSGI